MIKICIHVRKRDRERRREITNVGTSNPLKRPPLNDTFENFMTKRKIKYRID